MCTPDGCCQRDDRYICVVVKCKSVAVEVGGDAVLPICEPEYLRAEVGADISDAERGEGGHGGEPAEEIKASLRSIVHGLLGT